MCSLSLSFVSQPDQSSSDREENLFHLDGTSKQEELNDPSHSTLREALGKWADASSAGEDTLAGVSPAYLRQWFPTFG